ncbi:hypothetical protein DM785_02530 [Deinococcus actinosclerus]|nr:hypothetical protein DM785_02530 [Deinococcus actinosclerus]
MTGADVVGLLLGLLAVLVLLGGFLAFACFSLGFILPGVILAAVTGAGCWVLDRDARGTL